MWAPYVPDQQMPWNLRRVVHLHRRAGFAETWQELQRDLKDGPAASVARFQGGRQVYATVLEDWLGLAAPEVLAGPFTPLHLFQT